MSRTVSNSTQRPAKAKPDFTISSNSDNEEDDEWVSSSSGPVTPSNLSSDNEEDLSPVEPPTPVEAKRFAPILDQAVSVRTEVAMTPRAGTPPVAFLSSRVDTPPARPAPITQIADIRPQPPKVEPRLDNRARDQNMIEVQTIPRKQPMIKQVRSEASSPPSPPHQRNGHRQSSTRPPSLYSVNKADAPLRPHPLIRGQSFGLGTPTSAKPTPLAPLTTMPAKDMLGVHLSSSPPVLSPGGSQRSPSPVPSLKASLTTHGEHPSEAHKQLRRQSISSQVSNATISRPSTPSSRTNLERQRTLSTMSTSSLAALSSIVYPQHHPNSPPRHSAGHGYTSQFPPLDESGEGSETVHMLLPPPYLTAHWTVLAHRSPIRESYDRIVRAKRLQR